MTTNTFQELLYEIRDRVATVTLNRPERMNAWTATLTGELREALRLADNDPEVRCIVLTGAGRAFCAGAEMSRLSALQQGQTLQEVQASDDDPGQRFGFMLAVEKPLIAAINGAAAGIGVCMSLFCDIRYMAAGAKLTTAYARRGVIAEFGTAWMLPRLVGPMHAADLLLSARTVLAEEAAQMGLVKVLPAEGFATAVHARAAEIANLCSPRAVRVMKQQLLLTRQQQQSFAQACQLADVELQKCFDSEDFREGIAHYLAKRAPDFTGR
ncbi:putative enoyl-CoA hydratase echA8 [compost metagenome]